MNPEVIKVHINKYGKPVPSTLVYRHQNLNVKDSESAKGRFGWKAFGPNSVPFITRVINGEHVPYVAVRMIENHILSYDLKYLCDLVKNLTITATEEKLLNEINTTHSNNVYGPRPFQAGVDRIVSMEDAKKYFPMYFS